ncbi:MAG: DUF3095 domain-containing protein [Nitrospirota bacterium]|nr:MAG: DUF3095 domain-containing protein [Nitrospirota bacterium]
MNGISVASSTGRRSMDSPRTTEAFYKDLESFPDFRDFTEDRNFLRVPDDWFVVITDVKGSTHAIEQGRYKDVNTIGAAAISVTQELLQDDFPYVFGGDGSTMLIPPHSIEAVIHALLRLRCLSRAQFGMELRVGRIAVREVHATGSSIELAKHELTKGKCVAVFRGGGLREAERRIKDNEEKYCYTTEQSADLDLKGLSCRWQPIPNQHGCILSVLVMARIEPTADVYRDFLAELNRIFAGNIDEANPVNVGLMRYKTVNECVRDEKRYHSSRPTVSYFKRLFEIVAAVLIFKFHIPPLFFNPLHYKKSMRFHSDFRKFDDMLRMIIDGSPEQAAAIQQYLKQAHDKGEIFYGVHTSETALMTCYVQDVKDGCHIHFIDGGDGGYAMAAKQMKGQLSRGRTSPS